MNSESNNNIERIDDEENTVIIQDSENTNNAQADNQPQAIAVKKKLPLSCKIIYIISALCVLLYALFVIFPSFSDFFNKYISPSVRAVLAALTGWIPFSLAEYLILLIPLILVALVSFGIKYYGDSWRNVGVFCLIIFSLAAYIFSTFTVAFVPAYRGSRLDAKMGLDKQEVSTYDLMYTAIILSDQIKKEADNISLDDNGSSVMPYGYDRMNDELMLAYDKVCAKYDFVQSMDSKIKRVMLSEPMTYTHISGVYTFFTGEANLNTNFPDYTLPFTAAHEFAHQRGIAREDEANFIAFLVCIESDDAYIRYSGYLNLFEHVASALYSANPKYYASIYNDLPQKSKIEMAAYSNFFEKYKKTIISDVSGEWNDKFLTANGTEGTKSYGMVVDLAVAYYKQH